VNAKKIDIALILPFAVNRLGVYTGGEFENLLERTSPFFWNMLSVEVDKSTAEE